MRTFYQRFLPALMLGSLAGSALAQTVNDPADQTVCANSPTAPVIFTGTGTTYTWVNNNPTIGLPASGTGDIASFVAQNPNQTPLVASVTVTPFGGGGAAGTFANNTPIIIPATGTLGPATPDPSNIVVSGLSGTVTKVTAKLIGYNHQFPDDVDVMLVGPGTQNTLIMSDAGSDINAVSLTLTFDDNAASSLGDSFPSGTYKPTNSNLDGAGDTFAGGPPVSSTVASLTVFNGTAPNGTWSLYTVDDFGGDAGNFIEGWEISITTTGGGGSGAGPSQTFTYTVNPAPVPSLFTSTANGIRTAQVTGGASYERAKMVERINGYEIRQTEISSTGFFMLDQGGPFTISVIGVGGCRTAVTGTF